MITNTVYNTAGLVTLALLLIGAGIWFWLCKVGWVEFPAWLVRMFHYNIWRAKRQAERKLRWAERRCAIGERRWMWRQLTRGVSMLSDAKGELILTAKQLTQTLKGMEIKATGCTVIVGGRVYTDPNAVDMPQHHPPHAPCYVSPFPPPLPKFEKVDK